MQRYRLTVLDPSLAREFEIPLGITLVGREASTNLPILNPQVSRRHAQFINDGQICELVDLGSANGTFVNDERLSPQAPVTLVDGMKIRFGPVEIQVSVLDQESTDEAGAAPEAAGEPPDALPQAADAEPESAAQQEPDAELVLDLPEPEPPAMEEAAISPVEPQPETPQPPLEAALNGGPGADGAGGPPPAASIPSSGEPSEPFGLPGLTIYSHRLINYLPGIYQTDFMQRFLGMFESILTPIEWTVDGFDLFLDPDSSPSAFLAWLGSWYGLTFDASWNDDQRRRLLQESHAIFARRGTRWALGRILEIYTGHTPDIIDSGEGIEPFTFRVRLPLPETPANRTLITRLIDAHKPAYTSYRLELMT